MYKIGDRVIYPMQGAGKIVAIEKKEIYGQICEFYILQMPIANIRISIPVKNIDSKGIRPVMSKEDGRKVLEILRSESTHMSENWSQRYRENMENLKSGDPFEMAEIIRNLQIRDMEKGLSASEKKMLSKTKKMLISELIIAGSMSVEEAGTLIDEAITMDEDEILSDEEES
ncbi:MAG: CarD family transcriptional regulator [Peptoniphilaceae bacterium]|nr:CarD family transcriptional regulator [Peptoniphilaceae bacterium]MDY5766234.1 CarD family transcriptional regulator [Peptoniphilaceae bacterium]